MKHFYALLLVFILLAGVLIGCARDKSNKTDRGMTDTATVPDTSLPADVTPNESPDLGTSIENMLPQPNDGEVENGHAAYGNVDDGKSPDKKTIKDSETSATTGTNNNAVNGTGK